ncbi:UDP-N-acetylmuramoyl-tripeptide--D-alanyl-D-alanine ligase [Prevotella sp. PINT]|jgi:UDP-N-acetylmuramoyl-tripeptide--D-alanyl-D-alanine ligase|uniref:UDP-N-acetylmuramoyl-tripeptide--D-alanyl-D- alanine ligase n=1 Tax=Palleniella intestinalis TaxID=2736291 RepID=UPI001553AA03|nr:UDP-N-acetylmuramoyl-tripeptide--D-alanyl-D-alanine ligase [Palleniella intestinalis]NPD82691.1 UDP-N-acetylmuramoyl-tripeptide--D-alanyl-D-alanine ligase [Palleniella intestinalis]
MDISELYSLFLEHPVVTTDTRDCPKGSIFFALKGASFNGNEFARQALENGSSYAVIDEMAEGVTADDARLILVDDVLTTLQQLANHHRKALGTKIIGVTGTNGKTTTKELIAAVLSEKYNVLYTLGNFNNHIGVPKTLLRLTKEHEIAVIEMGANHPGEIKTLVDIVEPDCGIITNVGRAHLGGFGSFEGVIKTKGELYDFLRPKHATVFIHNENEHLKNIADGLALVKYGIEKANDLAVYGEVAECAPYLTFRWGKGSDAKNIVESKLIGDYNIYNMLAAATIGLTFGITEEQICHALTAYTPSNNRSQLTVTEHNRLVVDAYNANPTSMAAALENFKNMSVPHKMAILGSMGELGEVSHEEHCKIVETLKSIDLDDVWLVGEEFEKTNHPFRQFNDVEEVKEEIAENMPQDKYILIKGSNSQKLFQLPELL